MSVHLLLYIAGIFNPLVSQMETWVQEQFTENESIEWIGAYEGTLEKSFPLVLVMGRNGDQVKGIYQYKGIDQKFVLEGEWSNDKIHLIEWDQNDQLSGYVVLKADKHGFIGSWLDNKREHELDFDLFPIDDVKNWDWPILKGWIKKFTGRFSKGKADLLLQQDRNLFSGILKMKWANQIYFVSGECEDLVCEQVLLRISNETGDYVGGVKTHFIQNRIANVSLNLVDLPVEYFTLVQNDHLGLNIHGNLGLGVLQDHAIPEAAELIQPVASFFKEEPIQDQFNSDPGNRFQTRSYGWQDIYYFSDRLYSAALYAQDQDMYTAKTRVVNFDRKKKEEVLISSLFKRKINHLELFAEKVTTHLKEIGLDDLNATQFRHIGITENGFIVATDYDVLRGQTKLILPYEKFSDELAKGTIIESFIK